MKQTLSCFFLIALLSCNSSRPPWQNRIRVQIRDSTVEDYYLLSVRDASLVVAPYQGSSTTDAFLIAHSHSIPFDKIEAAIYTTESSPGILPALGGGLIGCAGGAIGGGYAMKQEGDFMLPIAGAAFGGFMGIVAGALIGNAFSHPEDKFVFDLKNNSDVLRDQAIYHDDEPTELQQIR